MPKANAVPAVTETAPAPGFVTAPGMVGIAGNSIAVSSVNAPAARLAPAVRRLPPRGNDLDPGDVGKIAYYCQRWVNTRGQAGPWGLITSYIVT